MKFYPPTIHIVMYIDISKFAFGNTSWGHLLRRIFFERTHFRPGAQTLKL